jgi:pyruvate dehydrogenase E2 component (dihydrolipoamide acetyltransferase)
MPFTVTMPKLSPTMTEGVVVKWNKNEGELVKEGELLLEIATDKATLEYNAIDEGYLRKQLVNEGDSVAVNSPIAIFSSDAKEDISSFMKEEKKEKIEDTPASAPTQKKEEKEPPGFLQPRFIPEEPLESIDYNMPKEDIHAKILASPLAKRLAKEKGINLASVKGTGPDGRVVSRDLDLAQKDTPVVFGEKGFPHIPAGTYEEEKLSPIRKVIAERLQQAKTFIPHFYVSQKIDASHLLMVKEELKTGGIAITINDLIVRATALALREHPEVNSGFNTVNNTIIRFKTIDIAMAVAMKEGLITPIIRYADCKNLGQISVEAKHLAKKAKDSKLEPYEYKGGSFTISNLGMFGVSDFLAIINPPQSAILAVSGIADTPVVKDDKIVPGKVMKLTLSCDHRVMDGVVGARFLKTLQKYMENPILLLVC